MNREDILAAARENGMKNEEYEKHAILKGDNVSALIGMLLGFVMFFAELWIKKEFDIGLATILLTMTATQTIYEGVKLHKKICIFVGLFIAVLAVLSLLLFVGAMVIV